MPIDQQYLDAIKRHEGFTPRATWDYKQNSNGYGTRAQSPGEVNDRDEAERRFVDEVTKARDIASRHAPNADAGTLAALTSLTYNAGDKWASSGLGEAIRAGDMNRARELFLQYNKAGGAVLPGLANRRSDEARWIGTGAPNSPAEAAPASAAPIIAAAPQKPASESNSPPAIPPDARLSAQAAPPAAPAAPQGTLQALAGLGIAAPQPEVAKQPAAAKPWQDDGANILPEPQQLRLAMPQLRIRRAVA